MSRRMRPNVAISDFDFEGLAWTRAQKAQQSGPERGLDERAKPRLLIPGTSGLGIVTARLVAALIRFGTQEDSFGYRRIACNRQRSVGTVVNRDVKRRC